MFARSVQVIKCVCVCVGACFVCLAGPPPSECGAASVVSGREALEEAYGNDGEGVLKPEDSVHKPGDDDESPAGKYCSRTGCGRLIVEGPDGSFDCVYQGRDGSKKVTQLLVIKGPCGSISFCVESLWTSPRA